MLLKTITHCARCGLDHTNLNAKPFDRPFAPQECAPLIWTHWVPCPVTGEPILITVLDNGLRCKAEPAAGWEVEPNE